MDYLTLNTHERNSISFLEYLEEYMSWDPLIQRLCL